MSCWDPWPRTELRLGITSKGRSKQGYFIWQCLASHHVNGHAGSVPRSSGRSVHFWQGPAKGERLASMEQSQPCTEHPQFYEEQGKDFLALWVPLDCPAWCLHQDMHVNSYPELGGNSHRTSGSAGADPYVGWHLKVGKEKMIALTHG